MREREREREREKVGREKDDRIFVRSNFFDSRLSASKDVMPDQQVSYS